MAMVGFHWVICSFSRIFQALGWVMMMVLIAVLCFIWIGIVLMYVPRVVIMLHDLSLIHI